MARTHSGNEKNMWLALLFFLGALFVAVAGVLSGGIFTIILVPLAVIAVIGAIAYTALGYAGGAGSQQEVEAARSDPLPHSEHQNVAPAPNTPDDLVDARRQVQ